MTGLVADLIGINRKLSEQALKKLKQLELDNIEGEVYKARRVIRKIRETRVPELPNGNNQSRYTIISA